MRPHIICHMLSSVDGRIDGEALETVTAEGEYEATAAQLGGNAWICGRTTINGAFLEAGLVDEVSLLLVPGTDAVRCRPSFDGVNPSRTSAVALKLQSVEPRPKDALWIRYQVVRS